MRTIAARVSAKYQVVIPKAVREALGLRPQDTLLFLVDEGMVFLHPKPASFTQVLRGLHRELWPDPNAWIEEERSSWE